MTQADVGTLREALQAGRPITRSKYATEFASLLPHDELALDPHEVMAYLANPETFVAEAMGVSVADYRGWQAAGGAIQCHARTRSGRRCRNLIADEDHDLTPKQWAVLQARQLTCWAHGGKALTAKEIWEAEA